MINYMLPQSYVSHMDEQFKNYVSAMVESNFVHVETQVKAFDKLTGNIFNTYTSKVSEFIKESKENAKETIRTGKVNLPCCAGNKR